MRCPGARPMRRIDLLGVDEIADGEMKMVFVDGTDQVLVIHQGGEFTATQGICSHEYFELDKGFLTGRHADLRAAPVAVRPDERRADRSAGRAAARDLRGRDRGRPRPDRGPGRAAPDQRGVGS